MNIVVVRLTDLVALCCNTKLFSIISPTQKRERERDAEFILSKRGAECGGDVEAQTELKTS